MWRFVFLFFIVAKSFSSVPPDTPAFPLPAQYRLVNDYNGMLPPTTARRLYEKLHALEAKNGTQIVLMTVPSTGSEGVESYSLRAASQWDIGNNGQGNGVLFLIDGRGFFYIRTGPGIAGAIPDVWLRNLIKNFIEPRWNKDHFLEAVEGALDAMIERASHEETQKATHGKVVQLTWRHFAGAGLAVLMLLYLAYSFAWRRFRGLNLLPFWAHGLVGVLLLSSASAVILIPDSVEALLDRRRVTSQRLGGIQSLTLAHEVRDLRKLAVPGTYTVILVIIPSVEEGSTFRQNLQDFSNLRPDVAVRVAYVNFNWNSDVLHRLYGLNMEILPYIMILGPDGHIVAADQGEKREGADLLGIWHSREAQRFVLGK